MKTKLITALLLTAVFSIFNFSETLTYDRKFSDPVQFDSMLSFKI